MTKAISYYEQGMSANVPEAIERLGHLYTIGTINADVPKIDYQIPGVPRLPEPTPREEQAISNLHAAQMHFDLALKTYSGRGDTQNSERIQKYSQLVGRHLAGQRQFLVIGGEFWGRRI